MKCLYMHTRDGYPAFYIKGRQICYASEWDAHDFNEMFAGSLRQLRKEQEASRKWREENKLEPFEYGYIRIMTDEELEDRIETEFDNYTIMEKWGKR